MRKPNLIALKDIMSTGVNPSVMFPKGTLFFAFLPLGGLPNITLAGVQPIILGIDARLPSNEEITLLTEKDMFKVGTDVAQELAKDKNKGSNNETSKSKGMSVNTKIGIGVGIIALIGLTIYYAKKK